MKTYGQLRHEHSIAQAQRLNKINEQPNARFLKLNTTLTPMHPVTF